MAFRLITLIVLSIGMLGAEPNTSSVSTPPAIRESSVIEEIVLDNQQIMVNGTPLNYEVRAGTVRVGHKDSSENAKIGFIAYLKKTAPDTDLSRRPIAFCFNGGPGSSSIWLQMGFLGPKIVAINSLDPPSLPIRCVDNPHTLLSICDLVFIDPISTGFSTVENSEKAREFYGVEEDILSFAETIRALLTQFNRWISPRILIGESYGTLRAIGLSRVLQDRFFIDIHGLVLISLVLDLGSIDAKNPSADIPCITYLPTYAAIAHYHGCLSPELNSQPVATVVTQARDFAKTAYATTLISGDSASQNALDQVRDQLHHYTSIPQNVVSYYGFRMLPEAFIREFLKDKNLIIGRYDGRMVTFRPPDEPAVWNDLMNYPDPSFYRIAGLFSSAFHDYLITDLGWKKESPYILINQEVHPWDWTVHSRPPAGWGYFSLLQDFRLTMAKNPNLKTFVAAGWYDLATPYFAQEYSISHLNLPPEIRSHITLKGYEAGHMLYLDQHVRGQLRSDLETFITSIEVPTCPASNLPKQH